MKKNPALKKLLPALIAALMMLADNDAIGQSTAFVATEEQAGPSEANQKGTEKTISLETFMQKFQRAYNVYFSYQAAAFKEIKVADTDLEKNRPKDPGTLLKKVLAPAGLTYEMISNVYIIKPLPPAPSGSLKKSVVTAVPISGTVKDKHGPLANVTVAEKAANNATSTDNAGRFSINVASPNATLVFSMVGYKTEEVKLSGNAQVDVVLDSMVEDLSAVVVTALGVSKAKKTLAYSVAEVKAEDLVKASNINVLKSLDGKVSGVNLTSLSSDPTSSVLVNIRGTTALPTASNANVSLRGQPLYVIDGVPVGTHTFTAKDGVDFGNILSQLNPEDIDNVSILKGGSAGALYGAEGGNGVVMITTKSGRGGKKGLGVTFNSSAVWDKPYQFIEEQMDFGQGERAFEWQYDNTDTWGPRLDGTYSDKYWDVNQQKWLTRSMISYNEDRMKAYLQTGNTLSNNISVYGNYSRGSFRLSLADMNNHGVMPNTLSSTVGSEAWNSRDLKSRPH